MQQIKNTISIKNNKDNGEIEAARLSEIIPQLRGFLDRMGRPLAPGDLTQRQFKTLETLSFESRPMSMSQLAKRMGVGQSTLSETIKRLVVSGYVLRQRLPEDDRVVVILLTKKAKSLARAARNASDEFFRKLCSSLGPQERKRFVESHLFIFETVRALAENGKPDKKNKRRLL